MGMYDSFEIQCPRCGNYKVEVQFKAYIGDYTSTCNWYKVGEKIEGFPKIPVYETDGIFTCKGKFYDCVVRIEKGVLMPPIFPIPENYKWAEFPRGNNTDRREKASEEETKRFTEKNKGNLFGAAARAFLDFQMSREGILRRIFVPRDPEYPNYVREENGWRRVNKLEEL